MNRQLRNIGIIAHVDAGKTTTTERILYYAGATHRVGEVHSGTTVMDFDPQERKRGITINSAATTVFWNGVQINLIDTPGHIDFNIEVNRSLRVLDGAVVVFDGVAGVEPQTETNWRLADQYGVPRLAFINKLDRVGADFLRTVGMMRERLSGRPLLLQLPLAADDREEGFRGVIDLVGMRTLVWASDKAGAGYAVGDIPESQQALARQYRAALEEAAAEQDESLLPAWLEGQALTADELRGAIRKGTLSGAFVPVLAGSAFRNKGVEPLLDAVVAYLPAPGEVRKDEALAGADADGPLAALAFKVVSDDHGTLVFVRVYRGRLRPGDTVLNASNGRRERVSRLYEIHADKREERESLEAGDIAGVLGLKDTLTGDSLSDPAHPLLLEKIEVPEPVIDVAIEPRTQADQQGLGKALQALCREDPSLRLRQDPETGQTILSGMGELQLEVSLEKLRSRHRVDVVVGRPQVAYRETISALREVTHVHRKQTGGPGQFAELKLRLEPLPRGEGLRFEDRVSGGAIPREFIPAVEAGVRRAAEAGVLAGFPAVDLQATLLDGGFHEKDSSALAFELAAAAAFREAFMKAGPLLLEPVMAVEVVTPPDYLGDCIGDLSRRRGEIRAQAHRGNAVVVEAWVPLGEMFGYIGTLRSLSSGRAQFTMQFGHYAAAPAAVTNRVLAR
ncbi:elongation factor G [Solimonas sp. K1W22B-7]|uniref:elongation factor G n=1 Tax=Solimonas sp. K1W22B-7 TaxID=2303331 RepID=UPI000E32FB76|nr:elongation factor G [Solimonas sp. K1W22B-7]AXQ31614.1 elongation factor G [Solimonas sp. K1W22B-7]